LRTLAKSGNVAGNMDAPGTVPETINCHQCNAPIDLAGQTAFTHVECSRCGALSVVPLKFGNFLLLNAIGIGGMGTVYKAIDLSLNRYLAVKILRKRLAGDPRFTESFAREARAAASINHPNVAQVYSFGEEEGQYYLAMELLERGSLDDRMTRLGKLPEKDVLDIGAQIAAGLRTAHQRGLLHRDIKPGNILFNDENAPKIVDFGLARAQHEATGDEAGMVWGTPYYIAPEKLRGQSEDFRSDMYSLGASLFHALAGRPPFDAKTASEVAAKHATTPAFSLKTYAPDTREFTAQVIGRMLAKEPAERYETYDALIHDLHEAERLLREAKAAPAIVTETGERISIGSVLCAVVALLVCGAVIWYVVKAALTMREGRLQKETEELRQQADFSKQEAERQQQQREEQIRQKAGEETQKLQALEAVANALCSNYDFKAALAKYENAGLNLETDAGRQLLEQRKSFARLLVEFKTQLAADFARRPYDSAGLPARDRVNVQGRLSRATDTQLIFATPYGELVANWGDLPPATLQKLAESYATAFAGMDKPSTGARRYLLLAAFAKQFGSDRLGVYLKQAAQLSPEVVPEIERVFGKG
jgi:hypothetical protein